MSHTIRLRGPWDYRPLARAELEADGSVRWDDRDLPAGGTMGMPADWGAALGNDFRGLVRFTRRFTQPTGLGEQTRVWLVVENVDWQATVTLNGTPLGCLQLANSPPAPCLLVFPSAPALPCPGRFNIMPHLLPRNELQVEVLVPATSPGDPLLPRPGREHLAGGLIGLVKLEIEAL